MNASVALVLLCLFVSMHVNELADACSPSKSPNDKWMPSDAGRYDFPPNKGLKKRAAEEAADGNAA